MTAIKHSPRNRMRALLPRLAALLLALCLLPAAAPAEEAENARADWVDFLLICNEGMNNDRGNAGNTLMLVSLNQATGQIKMLMFTWDTFIDYEGYDVPQKLDMPYRNNGPEEAVRVLNDNFHIGIDHFMSLNYLNLAYLIDAYGGVEVDISRAERNALNGMVASKRAQLQEMVSRGMLSQDAVDTLAGEYYLDGYGPATRLNGLQAVGFGWLQYDSVYNCCYRDIQVVSALFHSVGQSIAQSAVFWTDASGEPSLDAEDPRRPINLDHMTEEDRDFLLRQMSPIFEMSYNNLTREQIESISWALARAAYQASRQGVNVFDHIEYLILPLEATQPYDNVAGALGHLVDKEANAEAIRRFLFNEED